MVKGTIIFLLTMMLAVTVFASDTVETYSIVTDYWPPFRIEGQGNRIEGADREIMALVAERMGVRFAWHRRPWARCLTEIKYGEADIITGVAKNDERAEYIHYSEMPYHSCSPAFYVRSGYMSKRINRYESLYGYAIGYVRDSVYFERFDEDARLLKIAGNTEEQLVLMLASSRWDVIIGTDCQVEYDLLQRGLSKAIVQTLYQPDKSTDLYIGVSKQSSFLGRMDEFNKVLDELKREGLIDKIIGKYTGKE